MTKKDYPTFAKIANVDAFARGLARLDERGAPEACFMLIQGNVGLGKTSTLRWYAAQKAFPLVRMEPDLTGNQFLSLICNALGIAPPYSRMERMEKIIGALASKRQTLLIDEVEHGLDGSGKALEVLRAVSDAVELPMVLSGREKSIDRFLAKLPALHSRISIVIDYKPLTAKDFAAMLEPFELKVEEDVLERAVEQGGGRVRQLCNARERLRRIAKRLGNKTITLEHIGNEDISR